MLSNNVYFLSINALFEEKLLLQDLTTETISIGVGACLMTTVDEGPRSNEIEQPYWLRVIN
jgi:hypothetical protein